MKSYFIKGVLYIALAAIIYVCSYFGLRFTHIITHYQGVEGSWFEPEGGVIELIYFPMISSELSYRGLRYDAGYR